MKVWNLTLGKCVLTINEKLEKQEKNSKISATSCGDGNNLLVILRASGYKIEVWSLDKLVNN